MTQLFDELAHRRTSVRTASDDENPVEKRCHRVARRYEATANTRRSERATPRKERARDAVARPARCPPERHALHAGIGEALENSAEVVETAERGGRAASREANANMPGI
jgi:hypothetical protein